MIFTWLSNLLIVPLGIISVAFLVALGLIMSGVYAAMKIVEMAEDLNDMDKR